MAILLQNQCSQLKPVGQRRLQFSEPFPSSASQIELGNLKKFVRVEVAHLCRHTEPFSPIANILMIAPPKQFVHALRTSHPSKFQQQQEQDATFHTTHRPSKHKNKTGQPLGSYSDSTFERTIFA
jgi:hypothetical protein